MTGVEERDDGVKYFVKINVGRKSGSRANAPS